MKLSRSALFVSLVVVGWLLIGTTGKAEAVLGGATTDAWDTSNGITVPAHSGTLAGFPITNMFGTETTDTNTIFLDSLPAGSMHCVAWQAPSAVMIRSFNLSANHDAHRPAAQAQCFNPPELRRDANHRGFNRFTLYACGPDCDEGTRALLIDYTVPLGDDHEAHPGENALLYDPTGVITSNLNILDIRANVPASDTNLRSLFESPVADAVVSGVALIRGWVFSIFAEESIAAIQFFIDGVLDANAACCSERSDVQAVFPSFPAANTVNSGWGITKNWGNEDSGMHMIPVVVTGTSGEIFSDSRTVTVVKHADFAFLDQFEVNAATPAIVGQQVQLNGVQIRDKDSQATAEVDTALTWQGPSQQFEFQASATVAQALPQRMWVLKQWWQNIWTLFQPPSVTAQTTGFRIAWEGPVAGPVGGEDLVRGWGYEQDSAEFLAAIRFLINAEQNALTVCCSPRPDVAAAFPSEVNALNSGWGLTLNWRNLDAGTHTAQIEYESSSGEIVSSETRTITGVKPGGFGFLSGVDVSGATVSIDGEEIVLAGLTVTEAGTGNTATVTLRLLRDSGSQGLRLVSATTT